MNGLPDGWDLAKLGEIGEALIGLTYTPSSVRRSGTLVLRSSNVQGGRLVFDDNVYVDCAVPNRIRVRHQDILICVRNGSRRLIGKSAMLDHRVVGDTFGAFMAVFRSDANPYLRYFFRSEAFAHQVDEHLGATINQITNGSLKSFVVALPGEEERTAITERLDDAEDLIAALERLIVKRQGVKQGMMQQLLTGKTRIPGFNESWREATIGDIADQHRRTVDPRKHQTTEFQHFSLPAFDDGQQPVWERGSEIESMKFRVPPGAILVSKLNPRIPRIWAPESVSEQAVSSTEFIVMTARKGTDRSFFRWLMRSDAITARMKALATGTTGSHARVRPQQIAALYTNAPEITEQIAIAAVLDDTQANIDNLSLRLTKAKVIKQGMMQELLSGRTRLPVMDAAAA